MQGPGPHAVKPFIPLAPAAVVEHRAVERDNRLGGGDHELAVQEVLAVGSSESQVGGVARLILGLVLTDFNVGGARRDLNYVSVALTVGRERRQKLDQISASTGLRPTLLP